MPSAAKVVGVVVIQINQQVHPAGIVVYSAEPPQTLLSDFVSQSLGDIGSGMPLWSMSTLLMIKLLGKMSFCGVSPLYIYCLLTAPCCISDVITYISPTLPLFLYCTKVHVLCNSWLFCFLSRDVAECLMSYTCHNVLRGQKRIWRLQTPPLLPR